MRIGARPTLIAAVAAIALAVSLSACTERGPAKPVEADESVGVLTEIEYDYDPAASPAALADQSQLVVSGTLDRVQEGRLEITAGNEELADASTIVLVMREATAAQGAVENDSDGFIYIELPNPGGAAPETFDDSLPAGIGLVAYLVPAWDGEPAEGTDVAMADPEAGRPAGQPLYAPAGPQALILQRGSDTVVWPLIGETREGRLEDTLPGGTLIAP